VSKPGWDTVESGVFPTWDVCWMSQAGITAKSPGPDNSEAADAWAMPSPIWRQKRCQ